MGRKTFCNSILLVVILAGLFSGFSPVQASPHNQGVGTVLFFPFQALGQYQPPPSPVWIGQKVRFYGLSGNRLEGIVRFAEFRNELVMDTAPDDPVEPLGKFLVVLMDVTNYGTKTDQIATMTSFRAQCTTGVYYNLAGYEAHWAAQDEYERFSVGDYIAPDATLEGVFVFDVLPSDMRFNIVATKPW